MMLSIEEIKELVNFARSRKVKQLQIGNVKIEMSDYAFIEDVSAEPSVQKSPLERENLDGQKNWSDESDKMSQEEYDSLLFHSSNS